MLNLYQPVVAPGPGLQLKSVGAPADSSWPTQFQSGQHCNIFSGLVYFADTLG
jgi:hypothetical protein